MTAVPICSHSAFLDFFYPYMSVPYAKAQQQYILFDGFDLCA